MLLLCALWLLVLVIPGITQEVNQAESLDGDLSASGVSAEGLLSKGLTIESFIGNDDVLAFLNEDRDILNPGFNQELVSKLKNYNNELRDSKKAFEDATFEELEEDLYRLNDGLEAIYQKLLHFSRVLVSLTEDDMLAMADILVENKEYYDQIMDSSDLKIPRILEKRFFDEFETEIFDDSMETNEDTSKDVNDGDDKDKESQDYEEVVKNMEPEKVDMEEEFKEYWDPDHDYELLQDFMLEDVTGLSPNEKLNDLVQTSGILKKIKKKTGAVKYKVVMALKLLKMKKLLKSKKSLACLALIKTIEKIKRCLKHIKYCIIMKIKKFIKNFPWNVIYKLKILIRLIIKILLQILWELQFLICELLYKLYFLLKKLKKIPISIIMYLKKLCEKDGWDDEWDQDDDDRDGDWDDWNDNDWDEDDWDDDTDGFISYSISPIMKTPSEIDEIFDGVFSNREQKKIDKDSFNFDIEFDFNADIDSELDKIHLDKREFTELSNMSNITECNCTGSVVGNFNISVNTTISSNVTQHDSRGSTVGARIVSTYLLACVVVMVTRFVFRFL